jgi:acyl CoA:acetate/3-ketoacid CoA transferase
VHNKLLSAAEAVALIKDGQTIAIQGAGGGVAEPTALLRALGERFRQTAQPRELTLYHATGLGDRKEIGTDYLAQAGLVRRDIAGHLGMAPKMARMISNNEMESYNLPQGVMSQLYSAIAARQPGVLTKIGLHTYIDPRLEGGRMNRITTEDLVRVVTFDGEEWLYYPRLRMDVAFVRGTTADVRGNVTSEEEAAIHEGISIAQAVRACGGIVIAQVKYLAQAGTLDPRLVKIPGVCVDYVVVDPDQKQTCLHDYNPAFTGQVKIPLERIAPLPLDERKIIARRAAAELFAGAVVNLGVGVPSGVASVATEEGLIDQITFTVEHGIVGGMPAGGVIFGVAYNPEAIIEQDKQFNFYDGGGVDVAFLGMAQMDAAGNVNVSKVGDMLTGCGGFINISQSAKKVVFCGTLTAKGLQVAAGEGRLTLVREGSVAKLVAQVDQITFSARNALAAQQEVLYVTERAVFALTPTGVMLTEIAPGVDLQRDVLDQMGFVPQIADPLPTMQPALFRESLGGGA